MVSFFLVMFVLPALVIALALILAKRDGSSNG
jgi:hypothetical protein